VIGPEAKKKTFPEVDLLINEFLEKSESVQPTNSPLLLYKI